MSDSYSGEVQGRGVECPTRATIEEAFSAETGVVWLDGASDPMNRRSRLSSALLAGGVMTAMLGTHVVAAAPSPQIVRHEMRQVAGIKAGYQLGTMDGRSTWVGPMHQVRAAAALSNITITYKGTGWTAAAKAVFEDVAQYWESQLQSDVEITVVVTLKDLPGNTLGQAGPRNGFENFVGAPFGNTVYPVALANKLAGVDLDPGVPDITAQFDSRMPWYMGLDNVVPADKVSFRSTVMHELGHGLGFLGSGWVQNGRGSFGAAGFVANDDHWIYDLFAQNGAGTALLTLPNNSTRLGTALRSDNVWFQGVATDPRVKLYAPSTWDGGSSFSHLDERTFKRGTLNSLMTPIGDFGEGNATAGPIVLAMMNDMGWNAASPTACSAPGDLTGDGFNDVIGVSSTGDLTLAPGTDTGKLLARQNRSAGFGGFKPIVIEDFTGDGCADVIAATNVTHELLVLPVTGDFEVGTFGLITTWVDGPTTWTITGIAAVGRFTNDANNDLLVRANQLGPDPQKGQLWLIAGDGAGGALEPTSLGTGWASYTEFFSAGDWDGDSIGDLFVRTKANNGTLKLFPGNGFGGFKASKTKGTGWNFSSELFGSFDLSGDGFADIVGRDSTGALRIERATRTGDFISGTPVISKGWGSFQVID